MCGGASNRCLSHRRINTCLIQPLLILLYLVAQGKLSTHQPGPSFSLGASLRSSTGHTSSSGTPSDTPGPGSASPAPSSSCKGPATSPAWSLGARFEHGGIVAVSTTPGPGAYDPSGALGDTAARREGSRSGTPAGNSSPGAKGFSILGKVSGPDW